MKINLSTTLLLLFFSSNIYAGWFNSPSNYDECILESMKGVTSDKAARLISRSCRKKFPTKSLSDNAIELPQNVLQKIEGKAGVDTELGGNKFSADIFNGSEDWNVVSLIVRITNKKTKEHRDYTAFVFIDIYASYISPLSKGTVSFSMYKLPKDWTWNIISGKGYKK